MLGLSDLAFSQNQNTVRAQNMIIDLTQAKEPSRWYVVDDGVMGGVSFGQFEQYQNSARFIGKISLDNNGGFSSVYRKLNRLNSDFNRVSIDIVGDGQIYQLRMVSNLKGYRVAYKIDFKTKQGKRQVLNFALNDFKATFRGRLIPNAPKLTETEIGEVGFLMTKKQDGEFEIQINQIEFSKSASAQ